MTNKTSHPVPNYLNEELMQNNRERGVKFTLSHLMNDQMLLDSYILKKNKGPIERKKGVTINWQCLSQNCYFRATTMDACIEKTNGTHNHDPTVELFTKREGRVKLKEAVAFSDAPLESVFQSLDYYLFNTKCFLLQDCSECCCRDCRGRPLDSSRQ